MKKRLVLLALALSMLLGMTGCQSTTKKNNKIEISMYLWDKNMTRELTPWLQEQFPEIEFSFVAGFNSIDYYSYLNDHGELPDIITCRRFSLNDAAHLSTELLDLSKTDLVGSFYSSYIENNRETSGAIRWLPMCAEIDGIMANKALFDKYNIPLPTNYEEFVDTINRFEEIGIRGFLADFKSDYTCLELMQGSAIPELKSLEGMMWRAAYESETTESQVGLDDKVWPVVFKKFDQLLKDLHTTPEMTTYSFTEPATAFNNGKLAMMRATGNDAATSRKVYGTEATMLPYFGETSEDNWILTYPILQMAVNKKVAEDKTKEEAVMKVLEATFSEEGQRRLASGNAVLSYNKDVNITISDVLAEVEECIDRNHMYIRLASTEIFAISKNVAHKMIKGEYGHEEAYEDFNNQLTAVKEVNEPKIIITQTTAYPYENGEHGNPAASSVLNTLRKGLDKEIGIGFANVVTSSVFAQDYTAQQLQWLLAFKAYTTEAEYTGAEIIRIMEWLINVTEDGNNPIRHRNMIPTTSNMEYTMKDNGDGTFTFEGVTINGEPIDENKTYSVLLVGEYDILAAEIYCNSPMPEDLLAKRHDVEGATYYNHFINSAQELGQLEAPTEYVTINK